MTDTADGAHPAERWWPLWGPCSGGGQSVVIRDGRVFIHSYGDATPEGTDHERECTPAQFARAYADDPKAAPAIAWLRRLGLVG